MLCKLQSHGHNRCTCLDGQFQLCMANTKTYQALLTSSGGGGGESQEIVELEEDTEVDAEPRFDMFMKLRTKRYRLPNDSWLESTRENDPLASFEAANNGLDIAFHSLTYTYIKEKCFLEDKKLGKGTKETSRRPKTMLKDKMSSGSKKEKESQKKQQKRHA